MLNLHLNEQFAEQVWGIAGALVVIAIGLVLSRWQSLKHQRRIEDLRLAAVALVNSLERLTAQTPRDIERKSKQAATTSLKGGGNSIEELRAFNRGMYYRPRPVSPDDPLAQFQSEADIHGEPWKAVRDAV